MILWTQAWNMTHFDKSRRLAVCIDALKTYLDSKVYIHSTRQIVTVHELLHGVVLALRAYWIGDADRFIVPTIDTPNGGRPGKAGYHLYGRSAGRTDFWQEAKSLVET